MTDRNWRGSWNRPPIALIAPSKYVQGPGVLDNLGTYVAGWGKKALVCTSTGTWGRFGDRVTRALGEDFGIGVEPFAFSGESSQSQIDAGLAAIERSGADFVIGLGGGKVLDTAKAVGHFAGQKWATVPTIASTDGPCSSLSVVYFDDGELSHYIFIGKNPDLVAVDSQVVADAPVRFLAAGIADAVSTRFESAAAASSGTLNCAGGRPSAAALALGRLAWDIAREHGESALRACEAHAVTESLELVVEACMVHSGLGFESGGFSGAHAIHNGLTMVRSMDGALHGEKVNFGVLAQMVIERRPDRELDEFIDWSRRLGLPVTLAQLGASSLTDGELQKIAERTTIAGEGIHQLPFPVDAGMVASAILGADAYARGRLAAAGAA